MLRQYQELSDESPSISGTCCASSLRLAQQPAWELVWMLPRLLYYLYFAFSCAALSPTCRPTCMSLHNSDKMVLRNPEASCNWPLAYEGEVLIKKPEGLVYKSTSSVGEGNEKDALVGDQIGMSRARSVYVCKSHDAAAVLSAHFP